MLPALLLYPSSKLSRLKPTDPVRFSLYVYVRSGFSALKVKIDISIITVIVLFGLTTRCFLFPRRLANAIKVMLTISIYICYALSNFVAFDIMWRTAQKKFKIKTRKTLWSLGLRTLIVMTTCKYRAVGLEINTFWKTFRYTATDSRVKKYF